LLTQSHTRMALCSHQSLSFTLTLSLSLSLSNRRNKSGPPPFGRPVHYSSITRPNSAAHEVPKPEPRRPYVAAPLLVLLCAMPLSAQLATTPGNHGRRVGGLCSSRVQSSPAQASQVPTIHSRTAHLCLVA